MRGTRHVGSWLVWVLGVLLTASVAQAQCTKDTDCKGDRLCEAGKCVSPSAVPPAAASADAVPASDAGTGEPAKPARTSEPAHPDTPTNDASATTAATAATAGRPSPVDQPRVERRSRTAMVAGIIMASVGPVALLGALSAKNAQDRCDDALTRDYPSHVLPSSERYREDDCNAYSVPIYVLGIGGAALIAGSIPLIIYGAKAQPVRRPGHVQVLPWATTTAGGVRFRLDL